MLVLLSESRHADGQPARRPSAMQRFKIIYIEKKMHTHKHVHTHSHRNKHTWAVTCARTHWYLSTSQSQSVGFFVLFVCFFCFGFFLWVFNFLIFFLVLFFFVFKVRLRQVFPSLPLFF